MRILSLYLTASRYNPTGRVIPKPVKTIEIRSFDATYSQFMTLDTNQPGLGNKTCYDAIYAVGVNMCEGKRTIDRLILDNINRVEIELHEYDSPDVLFQNSSHQVTVFMQEIPDPKMSLWTN